MSDFGDKFDFDAPLPLEVLDGEYTANLKTWKKSDKQTKAKGSMFFLEFITVKSALGNTDSEDRKVTYLFMPKPRSDKYFSIFVREVKELAAAFGQKAPSIAEKDLGNGDAWEPFLDSLKGETGVIHCKNEMGKDGVERIRVRFTGPNKPVNLPASNDDET